LLIVPIIKSIMTVFFAFSNKLEKTLSTFYYFLISICQWTLK